MSHDQPTQQAADSAPEKSGVPGPSDTELRASGKKEKKGFLRFPRSWAEVKKLGWKFILAFLLFYLIRDTILYILLPYLIYKGIISL